MALGPSLMRPIVGDVYIKLPQGPVPVGALDLIHGNEAMDKELLAAAKHALEVIHNGEEHTVIRARREPDMEYFSESDHVGYSACLCPMFDQILGCIKRGHLPRTGLVQGGGQTEDFLCRYVRRASG